MKKSTLGLMALFALAAAIAPSIAAATDISQLFAIDWASLGAAGIMLANAPMAITEQIAMFDAKRKAAQDAASGIVNKSLEEGRTLDEAEAEQHKGYVAEVKAIDEHLTLLKAHEQLMVSKATPIEPGTGRGEGAVTIHGSGPISVRRNLEKGIPFVRYTLAMVAAKGNIDQAAKIARRWKDSTPEVLACLEYASENGHTGALLQKAAVNAGTTQSATYAGPLVQYQDMAAEFIELLRPMTILGKLTQLRRVPFNIRIARQTAGVTGAFVGEGLPKPVNALAFDNITMTWAKAAVIVILTDELVRFSNPAAEGLARQDMLAGIATYLDARFIDPAYSGVANVSPASITNGITPTASTGSTIAQITTDVTTMMSGFVTNNLNLQSGGWIMSPATALKLSMKRNVNDEFVYPTININGGTWHGLPVITSNSAVASGSPSEALIVLIDQSEILLADDGEISIDMSMEASVQMNDAPSAGAQSLVSLWQNNMVGLRAERYINWRRRRDAAVAVLGNVSY